MDFETIRYEKPEPGIAVATLARPDRLNTLTATLLRELDAAVDLAERDDDVRVLALAGAPRPDGRPCFSAGVDVRAFEAGDGVTEEAGFALTNRIDDLLKPVVAVVDGVCSTGGAELALACDLRIVGEAAEISDWHLKKLGTGLGAWGGATRWARLLGVQRAKEVILTGKVVTGAEAYRIGFASELHPSAALWERAMETLRAIAAMDPRGLRLTLAHLDRAQDMSRDQALRWAQLAPDWLGVRVRADELRGKVLGGRREPDGDA
ncbi:MAG: enoyl-CoA hydratase/isomerase family protein [Myxococcota bacterium]